MTDAVLDVAIDELERRARLHEQQGQECRELAAGLRKLLAVRPAPIPTAAAAVLESTRPSTPAEPGPQARLKAAGAVKEGRTAAAIEQAMLEVVKDGQIRTGKRIAELVHATTKAPEWSIKAVLARLVVQERVEKIGNGPHTTYRGIASATVSAVAPPPPRPSSPQTEPDAPVTHAASPARSIRASLAALIMRDVLVTDEPMTESKIEAAIKAVAGHVAIEDLSATLEDLVKERCCETLLKGGEQHYRRVAPLRQHEPTKPAPTVTFEHVSRAIGTLIPCADCGGAGRVNLDWKERGYRINQLREHRDRSRREFAKEIGVPAPLLAIVETGIYPPDEVERILRQKGFLS